MEDLEGDGAGVDIFVICGKSVAMGRPPNTATEGARRPSARGVLRKAIRASRKLGLSGSLHWVAASNRLAAFTADSASPLDWG